MGALTSVVVPIIIILAVALLILWVVQQFFPEFHYPARIIVGAIALIAIITKLLPLLK